MKSTERSRETKKTATRRALRAAAEAAFATGGWHATSIGSISKEAGVAHGTFYVHYPSKEAVMDELLGEFNADLAARLGPTLGDAGEPLEARIRSAADLLLRHFAKHKGFVRAYAERLGASFKVELLSEGVNPPAEALVKELLTGAGVPAPLAGPAALGLLALWLRVALQAVFNPKLKRADAIEVLTRMTVGAVDVLRKDEP